MSDSEMLAVRPIGLFEADSIYPYDVPRQGVMAGENQGVIHLRKGEGFEQALEELAGFSHIWVLFWFDRNSGWRPKVQPPRHVSHKVGVFASRSPYRPNPIGMSVVRLAGIRGLDVFISGHDLLDGTPVLDIKPYLPYADSFPEASLGWTGEDGLPQYSVGFMEEAERRIRWLEERGVPCIRSFAMDRLCSEPLNTSRHRLMPWGDGMALAYRTWRMPFHLEGGSAVVETVVSGYTSEELHDNADKYGDKQIHRDFLVFFGKGII